MSRVLDEQVLGLAGLYQAAALVEQIANRGMVNQTSLETSIYSIMQLNPKSSEEIYGQPQEVAFNLHLGFRNLQDLLEKPSASQNRDTIRYALSMLHLEARLRKQPQMLQALSQRLNQIIEQARFFSPENPDTPDSAYNPSMFCHPNIIENIASLYQDTLSTFNFRIQVTGNPRHLQNKENAAKVRALLLAGIRSAMLWRQKGGKRWHFLFFKSRFKSSVQHYLS